MLAAIQAVFERIMPRALLSMVVGTLEQDEARQRWQLHSAGNHYEVHVLEWERVAWQRAQLVAKEVLLVSSQTSMRLGIHPERSALARFGHQTPNCLQRCFYYRDSVHVCCTTGANLCCGKSIEAMRSKHIRCEALKGWTRHDILLLGQSISAVIFKVLVFYSTIQFTFVKTTPCNTLCCRSRRQPSVANGPSQANGNGRA